MNILFINSRKGDAFLRGGEKWILNAGKMLYQMGNTVTISGEKHSLLLELSRKCGLNTYELHIPSDFSPGVTWRLKNYLKSRHIDTVILNTNRDLRVAGPSAWFSGIKNVYARHGSKIIGNKKKYTLPLKWFTNGIITNTKSIKEEYDSYGIFPENFVKILYNGIDVKTDVHAFDFSTEYPGKKIVFSAGDLTKKKGFFDLIKSAYYLKKKRDDLIFIFAGQGGQAEKLSREIKNFKLEKTVFLIGFHLDILPFIKGADIFVLSSHKEGMPNVIMEAMMLKTPVVATNVNGIPELIEHKKSGWLTQIKRPEETAHGIEQLIDAPHLSHEICENAFQTIITHFSMQLMAEQLIDILNDN